MTTKQAQNLPDPLDQLAAMASANIEAEAAENDVHLVDTAPETPPPISNAQALAGAIAAGREAFCFFTKLQSPKQTLNDEQVQALSGLWAPVLDKHGIDLAKYLGDWALEIAAVIGTITVAAAVRSAAVAEIASLKQDAPSAEPAQTVTDASASQ